jgi:MFS superfamily sulfate permease-like transporter
VWCLFGAIALSAALDLNGNYGVAIVGTLPQGLSTLTFPKAPLTTYLAMVLPAMGVLLVAYSGRWAWPTSLPRSMAMRWDAD